MSSKHDLLTAIISLALIALTAVLTLTHSLTGGIETGIVAGLSSMLAYWFARGGAIISQNQAQQEQTPQNIDVAMLEPVVKAILDKLAQTPAENGDGGGDASQS
ncbi:MAG: hypothetical protein IRZ03_18385 [Acidobacterium ailaaui]|nr:hypothetical protein [Pseudacidobacterium ailaaui]